MAGARVAHIQFEKQAGEEMDIPKGITAVSTLDGKKRNVRPFRNYYPISSMSEVSIFFNGELLLSTEPTFEHVVKVNGSMVKHPLCLTLKKRDAKRQRLGEEKEEATTNATKTTV